MPNTWKDELLKLFRIKSGQYKGMIRWNDNELRQDVIDLIQNTIIPKAKEEAFNDREKLIKRYEDEIKHIHEYYYKKHPNKGKLARVVGVDGDFNYVLQVNKYVDSPDGIFIEVKLPNSENNND